MSAADNGPQGQAPEGPSLREISAEELHEILQAHRSWVESGGRDGKKADLSQVNLREANLKNAQLSKSNLHRANLENAILKKANLQDAFLKDANLREAFLGEANLRRAHLLDVNMQGAHLLDANMEGAVLWRANLEGAALGGANLQEADLYDANMQRAYLHEANFLHAKLTKVNLCGANLTRSTLREADLQDADLTGATGLLAGQLAGANVSGARLPEDISKFQGLEVVAVTSRNAGKVFLSMLLGCVYSWLTIATTTDARLLTNSASSPLPLIGTEIPIAWFYWAAPLILLCLYIYLHLYLQDLWRGLANLPAVFPDGRALDERAYPWLLNGLVRPHFKLLRTQRPPLSRLKVGISIFLAWWALPATLLLFWGRYLPRHDWVGTALHIVLLVFSIGFAITSYRLARATLRRKKIEPIHWKKALKTARVYMYGAATLAIAFCFYVISFGAIEGVPLYFVSLYDEHHEEASRLRVWVPLTLIVFSYGYGPFPFANLYEADVSIKPPNWTGQKELIALVKGARLTQSDLRHAFAARSFLVNADLRAADLRWAILNDADLRGANLGDRTVSLYTGARLQHAILRRTNLQGATLVTVHLEHSDLFGADLRDADLHGAQLDGANLQDADLRNAKGLTKDQIHRARNWPLAYYSKEHIVLLGLPIDHNERVKKKLAKLEKEKMATGIKP